MSTYLKDNDHIFCDIDSFDIWIKLSISIDSPFNSLEAELSLKIDKQMNGIEFAKIIQKLCLQIWNNFCEESQFAKDHIYILNMLKIQKIDKML